MLKNLKVALAVLTVVALVGCGPSLSEQSQVDLCMQVRMFEQCMKVVPAGPVNTQYNDWDEVVQSCESYAYRVSQRNPKFISAECKWSSR